MQNNKFCNENKGDKTMKQNLALLTDFYELTMMHGYLKNGMADKVAVFDLFFARAVKAVFELPVVLNNRKTTSKTFLLTKKK